MSGKKRYMSEFMVVWYLSHICEELRLGRVCALREPQLPCANPESFVRGRSFFSKFDEGVRIPIPLKVGHHLNDVLLACQ